MLKIVNVTSFYAALLCVLLCVYSIFALKHNFWMISPSVSILLVCSILIFIMGTAGVIDPNRKEGLRSWFTLAISFILTVLLLLAFFFTTTFSMEKELIKEVQSPDSHYNVSLYQTDPGAAGTISMLGELNGPLWFTKRIYFEDHAEQADIEWTKDHVIMINDEKINVKEESM